MFKYMVYAFGEWRCVLIVYVVLDMQSYFWDNVDKLFQVEFECYIDYICYCKKTHTMNHLVVA